MVKTLDECMKAIAPYLLSPLLFSYPPKPTRDGWWMTQKEAIEYGFAPEVEALTEALVDKITTETMTEKTRLLMQETAWRIALKFYTRDGIEGAVAYIYRSMSSEAVDTLNRAEVVVLDYLSWSLPFEEAARAFPQVLQRQVDRLTPLIVAATRLAADERARYQSGESTEGVALGFSMYSLWLRYLQERRREEAEALKTAPDTVPLEVEWRDLKSIRDFEQQARRMMKKRPMGPRE